MVTEKTAVITNEKGPGLRRAPSTHPPLLAGHSRTSALEQSTLDLGGDTTLERDQLLVGQRLDLTL